MFKRNKTSSRLFIQIVNYSSATFLIVYVQTVELYPTWCHFYQRFMRSFYARRSQKRKNIQLSHQYLFTLLGSARTKAAHRTLMKLTPEASSIIAAQQSSATSTLCHHSWKSIFYMPIKHSFKKYWLLFSLFRLQLHYCKLDLASFKIELIV